MRRSLLVVGLCCLLVLAGCGGTNSQPTASPSPTGTPTPDDGDGGTGDDGGTDGGTDGDGSVERPDWLGTAEQQAES